MKTLLLTNKDGELVEVPAINIVCGTCEGEGRVDHPAFSNGITSSEWADMTDDEQGRYMGGAYDVTCPECKGRRVLRVPDVSRMTFAQKRAAVYTRQAARAEQEVAAECAAERRFFNY